MCGGMTRKTKMLFPLPYNLMKDCRGYPVSAKSPYPYIIAVIEKCLYNFFHRGELRFKGA